MKLEEGTLVIPCTGSVTSTTIMSQGVDDRGRIIVNYGFQAEGMPSGNVFALGDCCITPINEPKTVYPIRLSSNILVKNLLQLAKYGKIKNFAKMPIVFPFLSSITLGPKDGVFIVNDKIEFGKSATKSK